MQRNQWILDEVAYAKKQGMKVDIGGVACTDKPEDEISKVLERGCYMLDYEGDIHGRLVALHIDLVEPFNKASYPPPHGGGSSHSEGSSRRTK